jgi:hypothetical protein
LEGLVTQPHEVRLHVCPLCAAPVEVEDGGWDDPYYEWTCTHERLVPGYGPERMTLGEWMDPERREERRSAFTMIVWERMHRESEERRAYLADVDWAKEYLKHPTHLYWKQYRRQRHELRHADVHKALKLIWSRDTPVGHALFQASPFLFAAQAETAFATQDMRDDIDRQSYGTEFRIPLKRDDS